MLNISSRFQLFKLIFLFLKYLSLKNIRKKNEQKRITCFLLFSLDKSNYFKDNKTTKSISITKTK